MVSGSTRKISDKISLVASFVFSSLRSIFPLMIPLRVDFCMNETFASACDNNFQLTEEAVRIFLESFQSQQFVKRDDELEAEIVVAIGSVAEDLRERNVSAADRIIQFRNLVIIREDILFVFDFGFRLEVGVEEVLIDCGTLDG